MAELYVNVNGTWKTASNYYVNVNGTWKEGSELHAKVSSAWKESGGTVYGGTSGIVSTNIVLDLNTTNSSSYGGSGTTWSDISGNSNDATLVNSPTYSSSNGGYLSFDGTDDHGTLPAIDLSGNEITFSIWTYNQATTSNISSLIYLEESASGGRVLNIHSIPYGGSSYYFDKGYSSGYDRLSGTVSSSSDHTGWTHWTFTANASTGSMKMYRNGTLYDSATGKTKTISNANGTNKRIARGNGTPTYNGFISQILLYKKELSASEVSQNYNATKGDYLGAISTTNLVLHLDAGKYNSYVGSGTTWTDISGNSNNGTLTNGPTFDSDFGGALVFDGSDDYVSLGTSINSDISQHKDCSFNIWLQLDDDSSDHIIFANQELATGSPLVLWYDQSAYSTNNTGTGDVGGGSTKVLTVLITDDSYGEKRYTTSNNVFGNNAANTWHNICVVLDPSNDKFYLYLNGVQKALYNSSVLLGIKSSTNNFYIGYGSSSSSLDGKVAQFHTYDKALSASEVLSNYNATKDTYGYATVSDPSGIIATGLDILLDAGNSNSYSGSGTTWTNLATSGQGYGNATLRSDTGLNTYSSNNSGYFDNPRAYLANTNTAVSGAAYKTMTYSVWCYMANMGVGAGYQTLIDQGDDRWFFGSNSNKVITYSPNSETATGTLVQGNWYNLTMTHTEGDVIKMYVNGVKVFTSSSTNSSGSGFTNWSFGAGGVSSSSSGNEVSSSYIAAIAVYNRALSATEVMQNHNALKSRFGL